MPSMRDFSGGVVNQNLLNKDSGGGILIDAKNVLASWNGEIRKRTGTRHLLSMNGPRIAIPFRHTDGNDLVFLIGDGVLEGYQFVSEHTLEPFLVYSGAAPIIPTSGWTSNANGTWDTSFDNQASATAYKAFNIPTDERPMKYYGKGGQYSYPGTTPSTPAFFTIQDSAEATVLSSLIVRWCNTVNGNRPAHYKGWVEPVLQYSDDGVHWTSVQTTCVNPYPTGGTSDYRASYHYGLDSTEKTENYVVMKIGNPAHREAHTHWRVYFASRIINNQTYDGERLELFVSGTTFMPATAVPFVSTIDFTVDDLPNIRFAQEKQQMFLTAKGKQPKTIVWDAGNFTISDFTPSSTSEIWTANGFPACVAIYGGRLWFAGFSVFPNRAMASAFSNFDDFTIPATILATSPIIADGRQLKAVIENMFGAEKALYLLSEDGVAMIDAPDGSVVSTSMIEMQLRNREPVNAMTPTVKDDIMMYLGRDRKKILITDYDFVVQRFKANNISQNYDDFLDDRVNELHYIPRKSALIYGSLASGKWFSMLFNSDMPKNALFPFDTFGFVSDLQPIKYGDETKLVMIVQREGQYFVEEKNAQAEQKLMDFMTVAEKQQYTKDVINGDLGYLDCMIKRQFETAVSVVSDLPYPSGAAVDVIADGVYLGERTLTSSISTGLFAWTNGSDTVYTTTDAPTTASSVNDSSSEIIPGASITLVSGDEITVKAYRQELRTMYAFGRTNSVNALALSGYSPAVSGDCPRKESVDGEFNGYYFGWSNSTDVFTAKANPKLGDSIHRIGGRGTFVVANVNGIGTKTLYYAPSNSVGSTTDVYNASGTVVASSAILNAYNYNYITVGGVRYYYASESNKTETITVDQTKVYTRDASKDISSQGVSLELDFEANTVIMGYTYDSYGVIKFATPYTTKKYPKEIACYFINTGYLELGNTFEDVESVLGNLSETFTLDGPQILLNGEYVKTLAKQVDETPYVIFRSKKGLPFMLTGLDYKVDQSNYRGGV